MPQLPNALQHFDDFRLLTKAEKNSFMARLHHVEEVIDNISSWIIGESEFKIITDFLEDLELDVSAIQNSGFGDDCISNWLIHSTWLSDFKPDQLRAALSPEMLAIFEDQQLSIAPTFDSVDKWLNQYRNGMCLSLSVIMETNCITTALSSILFLNSLLASLLAGLYRLRFA